MHESSAARGFDDLGQRAASAFIDDIDIDLQGIVKGELEPGERLLWAGRSEPIAERIGVGFLLFSIVAMIFMALGAVGIVLYLIARRRHHFDESSMGAGLLFVGVATVIVIALIANWLSRRNEFRRKSNIVYAVTDRRAIIWKPELHGDAVRIKTIERGEIKSVERVQRPDGSGNLYLKTETAQVLTDYDFDWNSLGFRDIHDVRRVEQVVRNNLVSTEKTT
jgi:hypothetical protein